MDVIIIMSQQRDNSMSTMNPRTKLPPRRILTFVMTTMRAEYYIAAPKTNSQTYRCSHRFSSQAPRTPSQTHETPQMCPGFGWWSLVHRCRGISDRDPIWCSLLQWNRTHNLWTRHSKLIRTQKLNIPSKNTEVRDFFSREFCALPWNGRLRTGYAMNIMSQKCNVVERHIFCTAPTTRHNRDMRQFRHDSRIEWKGNNCFFKAPSPEVYMFTS